MYLEWLFWPQVISNRGGSGTFTMQISRLKQGFRPLDTPPTYGLIHCHTLQIDAPKVEIADCDSSRKITFPSLQVGFQCSPVFQSHVGLRPICAYIHRLKIFEERRLRVSTTFAGDISDEHPQHALSGKSHPSVLREASYQETFSNISCR
jgi:hypothetical protein